MTSTRRPAAPRAPGRPDSSSPVGVRSSLSAALGAAATGAWRGRDTTPIARAAEFTSRGIGPRTDARLGRGTNLAQQAGPGVGSIADIGLSSKGRRTAAEGPLIQDRARRDGQHGGTIWAAGHRPVRSRVPAWRPDHFDLGHALSRRQQLGSTADRRRASVLVEIARALLALTGLLAWGVLAGFLTATGVK